jgi:hypothetical protein
MTKPCSKTEMITVTVERFNDSSASATRDQKPFGGC